VGMAVASVGMIVGPASAAPGGTSSATTIVHVGVNDQIALTGLTGAFTLNGLPGATVTDADAVLMNVNTNNVAGYTVTVQAETTALVGALGAANTDTIPIGALSVVDVNGAFAPLSSSAAVTVFSKANRSVEGVGDTIVNGYQVVIPFVNQDVYTATLNYIATTL
jgi:hypothetical protein